MDSEAQDRTYSLKDNTYSKYRKLSQLTTQGKPLSITMHNIATHTAKDKRKTGMVDHNDIRQRQKEACRDKKEFMIKAVHFLGSYLCTFC